MSDLILSHCAFSHALNVPIDQVDIADWLFNLPDAEYRRCCAPDHVAAGATMTEDGRRMSINVETIGDSLMVHHYVGEMTEPHYCRMVSQTDMFTPRGCTKLHVMWELSAVGLDAQRCEYTSRVTTKATEPLLAFMYEHGIRLEELRAARQAATSDHVRRETPLFAASIERRATAQWGWRKAFRARRQA